MQKRIISILIAIVTLLAPLTPSLAQSMPDSHASPASRIRLCSDQKNKGQGTLESGIIDLIDQYQAIGYKLSDICQEGDSTISALIYRQDEPSCEAMLSKPCGTDTEILLSFRSDKKLTYKVILNHSLGLAGPEFPNFCFIDYINSGVGKNTALILCGNGEGGSVTWAKASRTTGNVTWVKAWANKQNAYRTFFPSILKQFRTQQTWY